MAFSEKYLNECVTYHYWLQKPTAVGDWYFDLYRRELGVVTADKMAEVRFDHPRFALVPDTDGLLELIDTQLFGPGGKAGDRQFEIGCGSEIGWWARVEVAGRSFKAGLFESPHLALLHLLIQIMLTLRELRRSQNQEFPTDGNAGGTRAPG